MPENNDIYTLRFYGNDVSPESFSLKELGQLFLSFEEALQSIIEILGLDPKDVDVSLVGIANKSNSLSILPKNETSRYAVNQYGDFVKNDKYTNLPEQAYSFHKKLVSIIQEKKCNVSFTVNDNPIFDVKNEDEFIKQDSVSLKIKKVLYGHLLGLSTASSESQKARARIELFTGEKLSFEISENDRTLLIPYLWNVVGVNGVATFNTLTKSYIRFKLQNVVAYKKGDIVEGIEKIKNLTSGFWDKFETDDDITNYLKH